MSRGYFDQHGNYVPHVPSHPVAVEALRIMRELLLVCPPCPECAQGEHSACAGEAGGSCMCWGGGHLIPPTVIR